MSISSSARSKRPGSHSRTEPGGRKLCRTASRRRRGDAPLADRQHHRGQRGLCCIEVQASQVVAEVAGHADAQPSSRRRFHLRRDGCGCARSQGSRGGAIEAHQLAVIHPLPRLIKQLQQQSPKGLLVFLGNQLFDQPQVRCKIIQRKARAEQSDKDSISSAARLGAAGSFAKDHFISSITGSRTACGTRWSSTSAIRSRASSTRAVVSSE